MRSLGTVLSVSTLLLHSASAAPALLRSLPTDGLIATPDLSGFDSLANTDALTGTTDGLNIVKKGLLPTLPTTGLVATPDLAAVDGLADTEGLTDTDSLTGATEGLKIVKKGLLPALDKLVAAPGSLVPGLDNGATPGVTQLANSFKRGLLPSGLLPTNGLATTPDVASVGSLAGTDGLKNTDMGSVASTEGLANTDSLTGATPDLTKGVDSLANTATLGGITQGFNVVKKGLLPSGLLPTNELTTTPDVAGVDSLGSTDGLTNTDALTGTTPDLTKGVDSLANTVTLGGVTQGFNVVKKGLLPALDELVAAPGALTGSSETDAIPGVTELANSFKRDLLPSGLLPTGGDELAATPGLKKSVDTLANTVTLGGVTQGFNVVKKGLLPALDELVAAPGTLAPVDGLDNGAIPGVTQLANSFKRGLLPSVILSTGGQGLVAAPELDSLANTDALTEGSPDLDILERGLLPIGLLPTSGEGLAPTPDLHSVVDTDALGDTPNVNILTRGLLPAGLLPTQGEGLVPTPDLHSVVDTDALGETPNLNILTRGLLPSGLLPTKGEGLVPTPDLHSAADTNALTDGIPNLNILTRDLLKSGILPTDGLLKTPESLGDIDSLANTDVLMGATEDLDAMEKRGLLKALTGAVDTLSKQVSKATSTNDILNLLVSAAPASAAPANETALQSTLQSIWGSTPSNWYSALGTQILAGVIPDVSLGSLTTIVDPTTGTSSVVNNNPREPSEPVFPQKGVKDAPYSLSEAELREIIYFPEEFTYGQKQPVILVPGTAVYGGETFEHNWAKLLKGVDYADPLWLNIPKASLSDAQVNSEYVAYAINYVAGITNRNVSILTYSQGGPNAQWALTFWPSTRNVVSNFFGVSPDFHGTVLANLLCLNLGGSTGIGPCDPSVIQQEYTSKYVKALLKKDSGSAWVPTTTLYSGLLDEIVQPQGGPGGSGYRLDIRDVGVTNNEPQLICPGKLAGSFYGHAGMLYNPITFALVKDALINGGPGQVKRIDLDEVCPLYIAPGLSLTDAILTSGTIILAGIRVLAYFPKYLTEPALMAYVNNDVS